MQITFTKTFLKDLAKVSPAKRRVQIEKFVFEELQKFNSLEEIGSAEKITGYTNFYKIRIGIFKFSDSIELRRVLNRKEIYKYFP